MTCLNCDLATRLSCNYRAFWRSGDTLNTRRQLAAIAKHVSVHRYLCGEHNSSNVQAIVYSLPYFRQAVAPYLHDPAARSEI